MKLAEKAGSGSHQENKKNNTRRETCREVGLVAGCGRARIYHSI